MADKIYGTKIDQLQASKEFQDYLNRGLITLSQVQGKDSTNKDNYQSITAELSRLKKQDEQIGQEYKLYTNKDITPELLQKYSKITDPALRAAYLQKESNTAPATGGFNDAITQTVTEKLGRAPTTAELGYFGKQMEAGNLDAYGLQEFLSGTTEYQTKASDTARGKLANELGAVDDTYLAKTQKALESRYAAAGRSGASAFGSSLIGAGKDLATERTGYLAGLGYQDFQQGQGNLTAAYNNRLNQMYNQQQNTASLGNESRNRYYSQQDFERQQAAQERLARLSQPKQASFLQTLAPYAINAGASLYAAKLGQK